MLFNLQGLLSIPATFSEAWQLAWETKLKHLSRSEFELKRYQKHIKPIVGHFKLEEITPLVLEQLKNNLLAQNLKAQTVTHIIGLIRRTFNLLILWGLYEQVNPVSKIKLPREDNRRHRYLTRDEATILLEAVRARSEPTWRLSLLSLTTGMRAGEMLKLKGEHVDLRSGTVRVVDSKNGKNRIIYLPEVALAMFKSMPIVAGNYVFKNSKGKRFSTISDSFPRTVTKLGFNEGLTDSRDKVVFHTLRHTFASWLAQEGHSMPLLSELLGHSTLAMTHRYTHMSPEKKQAATATIDQAFLSICKIDGECKQIIESYG